LPPKKAIVPITAFSVEFENTGLFEFAPGTFRYEGVVNGAGPGDTLLIRAAADEGIALEILVDAMSKGAADGELEISGIAAPVSGGAAISVEVRARKGNAMSAYTAEISPAQSQADNDSTLQSIVVSYNSTEANRLSPAFTKEGLSYSMSSENGQTTGYVKAAASSENANIEVWYGESELLSGSGTATVERTFTLPARNANKDLSIKVTSEDGQSHKLYTVKVFGYQDQTTTYNGTVTCALSGYVIRGVTAMNAAGTQGAQIQFDSTAVANGYPWSLSAAETWVPSAFTVTLEKTEGQVAIESVAFAVAQSALSGTIALAITAPSQIGYRIFDANDFYNYLNNSVYRTTNFALAANIDLADYTGAGGQPVDWVGPSNYQGTLYGNGYTIKNLVLKPSSRDLGLFKSVGTGARLQDFTLEVSTANPNAVYSSGLFFGGVAGTLLENAANVTIEKVTVKGELAIGGSLSYLDVGAFVGVLEGGTSLTIERCVSQLNIALNGGGNSNSKQFCSFGGFVGTPGGAVTIRNSYSTGDVNVYHNLGKRMLRAGGFVGSSWSDSDRPGTSAIIIENSYAAGSIIAEKNAATDGTVYEYCELSAGAMVGSVNDRSSLTIRNSAALNDSVLALCSTAPETVYIAPVLRANYGRLVGSVFSNAAAVSVQFENNAALKGMKLGYTSPGTANNDDGDANGPQGAGVTAAALRNASYWTGTLGWSASVWDFSGLSQGKWPTLK
jgi:hypothetical protein